MSSPFAKAWAVLKSAYHPAIAGLMQRENMREAMGPGYSRDDFQDELSESSPFDINHQQRMALDEAAGRIKRRSTGLARGPPEPSIENEIALDRENLSEPSIEDEMALDRQAEKVENDPTEGFYRRDHQNPGRRY